MTHQSDSEAEGGVVMSFTDLTLSDLEGANWRDFENEELTLQGLQHLCAILGCCWECDPMDPAAYHAERSSGMHSDDFFNLADAMRSSRFLCQVLASRVVAKVFELERVEFDAVVGSATGSTILAQTIAEMTGARHLKMVKGVEKRQVWKPGQELTGRGDVIFPVEELTSTLSTPPRVVDAVRRAYEQQNQQLFWTHFGVVVVDRRPEEQHQTNLTPRIAGAYQLHSLLQFPSRLWKPEECPMCKLGSQAIRPRGNDGRNWELLTSTA